MHYLLGTDTPGSVSPPAGDLYRNRRLQLAADCGMMRDKRGDLVRDFDSRRGDYLSVLLCL